MRRNDHARAKCKVTVTFNANQVGASTGPLTITDNPTSGPLNLSLGGKLKDPKVKQKLARMEQ